MDSNLNMYLSERLFIDRHKRELYSDGCSLKKRTLKHWIYDNYYTQPYLAHQLNMRVSDFKKKLKNREKFTTYQVTLLIYFLGAETAIEVIYFPTYKERLRVKRETFGRKL